MYCRKSDVVGIGLPFNLLQFWKCWNTAILLFCEWDVVLFILFYSFFFCIIINITYFIRFVDFGIGNKKKTEQKNHKY